MFDSTIQGSLDSVKRWKDELDSKITLPNGKPLPIMILANKCDLENSNIDEVRSGEQLHRLAKGMSFSVRCDCF